MTRQTASERKEKYRALCVAEKSIPIFSRDWWLDATAGSEAWDVALVEQEDVIVAAMPYALRRRYGFSVIGQPPLTQTLGPWMRPDGPKPARYAASDKKIMSELIGQLPAFDLFRQNWHHSRGNWLPFYWKGFQQTTRYTYVQEELGDEARLWSGLQDNIRSDIKKATSRFKLQVVDTLPVDDFIRLNRLTFARQQLALPYSDDYVRRLDAACEAHGCRKCLIAVDPDGRQHAGAYIVWDENSAYYLMGGGDPELRNSGATSLCLWEAIRFSAGVTRCFDFEGSMLESVEKFFRAFGARQQPYFEISKTPSRLLRAWYALRSLLRNP